MSPTSYLTVRDRPGTDRADWPHPCDQDRTEVLVSGDTAAELLQRAAAGDQLAWDAIVERYVNLLWSVARAHRLDTADGADVVQTTWLRLLENLDRIRDPERLGGWLVTTARRECLRTLGRRGRESLGAIDGELEPLDDEEPLDARLLAEERDAMLARAFGHLPARCQSLLRVLMASPPPSYEEVSAALAMPVGSIGPTRGRCLERLRRLAGDAGLLDVALAAEGPA